MRASGVSAPARRRLGKKAAQRPVMTSEPTPPMTHGAHRSPPLRGEAAFKFAEFIGGSDKEGVDGADASAHGGRGGQLQHGGADDDADHVRGADDEQGSEREGQAAGESEENGGSAEDGDAGEHFGAGAAVDGAHHQPEGDDQGAQGRGGAQHAEAARAGVEDVLGEDGHERDGAAEQHGEEVQRDGAEQDLGFGHVAEAGEENVFGDGAVFHAAGAHAEREDEDEEPEDAAEHESIDEGGSMQMSAQRQGEEDAAEGGADDVGDLEDGRAPGDGVDEVLGGDEVGNERGTGGSGEGAAGADERRARQRWATPGGCRSRQSAAERRLQKRLERVADEDDLAAVEAVGNVAGGQDEEQAGQKEHEAGVAEVDGFVGDGVDLPGDGERLRLRAKDDDDARELIADKVAVRETRQRPGACHSSYTGRGVTGPPARGRTW